MTRIERDQKERIKKLAFWEPHVRCWQESKTSVKQYCKENNLNRSTFTYWQYIVLGKPKSIEVSLPQPSIMPLFLEVKTGEKSSIEPPTLLRIETPKGIKVFLESSNLEKDLETILRLSE